MTLTEISYFSRRLAPFLIIAGLVVLIIFYAVRLLFIVLDTNQGESITLNIAFDKIPEPRIPEAKSGSGISYTLDTIEGEPITASAAAKVLFLPPPMTTFGYREKIYVIAKSVGINTETIQHQLQDQTAVFDDGSQRLEIDISNFNFRYEYFFEQDRELLGSAQTAQTRSITERGGAFLNSIGRYPEALSAGRADVSYFRYNQSDNSISAVEAAGQANVARVDYYRPDIDGFPTVSPNYFDSPNYVLMMFSSRGERVLRAQIKFFEEAPDQIGVYPLRTGKEAYQKLEEGSAYIISNPTRAKNIAIKKMFLAYYDPQVYQEYLQPVYVFLGDNNFVAYVTAIADEYIAK